MKLEIFPCWFVLFDGFLTRNTIPLLLLSLSFCIYLTYLCVALMIFFLILPPFANEPSSIESLCELIN